VGVFDLVISPASRRRIFFHHRLLDEIEQAGLRIFQLNPKPASFSRWENQRDIGWSMTPPV
jgi:hypothetical protein